ncbi:hypothetical protein BC833DRAFT_611639 [Globomyces pollinis-pini]|nr:hypothetical protein BC833DRAFT_611639 [Globomyces pollinis-pini]
MKCWDTLNKAILTNPNESMTKKSNSSISMEPEIIATNSKNLESNYQPTRPQPIFKNPTKLENDKAERLKRSRDFHSKLKKYVPELKFISYTKKNTSYINPFRSIQIDNKRKIDDDEDVIIINKKPKSYIDNLLYYADGTVETHHVIYEDVPRDLLFRMFHQGNTSVSKKIGEKVHVCKITHEHPCKNSYGLFALMDLKPSQSLGDYSGKLRVDLKSDTNPPDADNDYLYLLYEDDDYKVTIDASKYGNHARYINDYRGVHDSFGSPLSPNCDIVPYYDSVTGELRAGVVITKRVKKGEEILFDYGDTYWEVKKRNEEANEAFDEWEQYDQALFNF